MGDVGSLALGAALGIVALITRQELVLLLVGGVFVVEALSVIGQVASFKLRRKRIFRMAPIHHHFELLGWPEPQIIVRFWIVADRLRAARALDAEAALMTSAAAARSCSASGAPGQAVARVLAARGARRARRRRAGRRGARRRRGGVPRRRAAARRRRRRRCSTASTWWCRARACRAARRCSPRPCAARHPGRERDRAGVAACSTARSSAITGTNGKSTTTTLVGLRPRAARAGARSPAATSARRSIDARRRGARRRGRRGVELPARVGRALPPARRLPPERDADHLDRHAELRGVPRRQGAALRARRARTTRRC